MNFTNLKFYKNPSYTFCDPANSNFPPPIVTFYDTIISSSCQLCATLNSHPECISDLTQLTVRGTWNEPQSNQRVLIYLLQFRFRRRSVDDDVARRAYDMGELQQTRPKLPASASQILRKVSRLWWLDRQRIIKRRPLGLYRRGIL